MRTAKKRFFTASKYLLCVAVLCATFFGIFSPAFAQDFEPSLPTSDATYEDYLKLFSESTSAGVSVGPILTQANPGWSVNANGIIDGVLLYFRAEFPFERNTNRGADWHWDHIAEGTAAFFSNDTEEVQKDGFVIRTCPFKDSVSIDRNQCMLSRVPHEVVCGTSNNACRVEEYSKAIYKFAGKEVRTAVGVQVLKELNTRFGVIFAARTFHPIATIGTTNDLEATPTATLTPGQTYAADMWYCAGKPEISGSIPPPSGASFTETKEMKRFGEICKGDDTRTYFRIGQPITFTYPTAQTLSELTPVGTVTDPLADNQDKRDPTDDVLPQCSWFDITGSGTFNGCIAKGVYFLIFRPIAWFAGVVGSLFDFFLGYSLDDASYRLDFAVTGWKLVRDICNVFFIVILIWTGFAAVFGLESVSMKRVVPSLILNAVLINFSLFGTRLLIDISNIFARVLYNSMEVQQRNPDGTFTSRTTRGPGGYRPISEKIVSAFNPQRMFATVYISPKNASQGGIVSGSTLNESAGVDAQSTVNAVNNGYLFERDTKEYANYFIIVSIIAAAILFSVMVLFWKTMFLFLGRVVGLYMSMIFSPFAFLTRGNMPLIGSIEQIKWSDWVKDLTNYSILAPIFMLFLYVVYSFANSDFVKSFSAFSREDTSFFGVVMTICIPLLIIFFFISYGVKLAQKYSGTIGTIVQGKLNGVAGFVGGAALGVGALGMSRVVGGAAAKLDQSRFGVGVRNLASQKGITGWFGRNLQRGLNSTRSGSFDVRQTGLGNALFSQLGVSVNQKGLDTLKGIGLGLSTEQRKGGFDADAKRRQEEKEKAAKLLEEKMAEDEVKKYNAKQKKKYDKKVDAIVEVGMAKKFTAAVVTTLKSEIDALKDKKDPASKAEYEKKQKEYDDMKIDILKNDTDVKAKVAEVKEPKQMRSTDEMNAARRKEYAEGLKKRGLFDQTLGRIPIFGALTGTGVRVTGDNKAAKKIEEKTKVEKELTEIQETLEKGFKDLIAIEMYQDSARFTSLSATEKEDVMRGTKSMFDLMNDDEKAAIEARRKTLAKETESQFLDLVKLREQRKYDVKDINKEVKKAEKDWYAASDADKPAKFEEYREALKKKWQAEEKQKVFKNVTEAIKSRKEKLKDKEEKS